MGKAGICTPTAPIIRFDMPTQTDMSLRSRSGGPTFYATGTAYRGLTPLEEILYRWLFQTTYQMVQLGPQTQQALDWLSRPRNSTCLSASTAAGSLVGADIGVFALQRTPRHHIQPFSKLKHNSDLNP